MTTVTRRDLPMLGELFDWLDGEFRMLPAVRAAATGHGIRVEDYIEDGHYVIRAELPGVDPAKDLEVTTQEGYLEIRAERREESKEGGRSEFRYGAFARTVALPPGADEDDVVATYSDGILIVRVGLTGEQWPPVKRVPVTVATPAVEPAADGEPPAAT